MQGPAAVTGHAQVSEVAEAARQHGQEAEYLYGAYRGQWVVMREGGVCEALPNEEDAGRTAALSLADQGFEAALVEREKRVLLVDLDEQGKVLGMFQASSKMRWREKRSGVKKGRR